MWLVGIRWKLRFRICGSKHLHGRVAIIIIGNVGWLLLKILGGLKQSSIDLGLTIANLRHCEFQRAIMDSFMQNLNIYGYKALNRKSFPRFHFKCDRATKGIRYAALRDLIYLVQE